jgi:hypothetical protein
VERCRISAKILWGSRNQLTHSGLPASGSLCNRRSTASRRLRRLPRYGDTNVMNVGITMARVLDLLGFRPLDLLPWRTRPHSWRPPTHMIRDVAWPEWNEF